MAEGPVDGVQADSLAEADQPQVDESLTRGSSTGVEDELLRSVIHARREHSRRAPAQPGVPGRPPMTTASPRSECGTSELGHADAVQPADLPAALEAVARAPNAASAALHAIGSGVPAAAGNITAGPFGSVPLMATADSALPGASQASAATRDNVAGETGAPAAAPFAACSPKASPAPAGSLQGVSSACDKASDEGSDVGSGSGGNTSSGGADDPEHLSGGSDSVDGSGSGPEQQSLSDDQAFSTPKQPCSVSDDPSLTSKGRPCLKRRVANREAAQRVRQRRRLEFDAMQTKVATLVGDTERLVARIAVAEAARDATARQLAALKAQLAAEHAARAQLQADAALQVAAPGGGCLVSNGAPVATLQPSIGHVGASLAAAAAAGLMGAPAAVAAAWPPAALAGPHFGAAAANSTQMGFGSSPSVTSLACAERRPLPLLGCGPLTTGMSNPPPSLHVRRQPHCCIVSSGWAPPAAQAQAPHPAAVTSAHPGAAGALRARGDAGAPARSARLRQRQHQEAQPAPQAAAAAAHARLASQLQRSPAMVVPQLQQHTLQQHPLPATLVPRRAAGGGGAMAAAALMPPPAVPTATDLVAPAGSGVSAGGGPVPSAFAAYSLLPFAD